MSRSAFELVILESRRLFEPLEYYLQSGEGVRDLFADMGWTLDTEAPDLADILSLIEDLQQFDDSSDWDEYLALFQKFGAALHALKNLQSRIQGLPTALAEELQQDLPEKLTGLLLVLYLQRYHAATLAFLQLFRVVELLHHDYTADKSGYMEIHIDWNNLGKAIAAPGELLKTAYHWGSPDQALDADALLGAIRALLVAFEIPVSTESALTIPSERLFYPESATPDEATIAAVSLLRVPFVEIANPDVGFTSAGLILLPIPDRNVDPTKLQGLALIPYSQGGPTLTFALSNSLGLSVTGNLDAGFGITILPPDRVDLVLDLFGPAAIEGALALTLVHQLPEGKFVVLGGPDSSRLDYGSLSVLAGTATASAGLDFRFELGISRGALVIQGGEGDGFLKKLLPSDPITINFDVTLGWSTRKGFYVSGGAGFEYTFSINKELGPFFINTLDLGLYLDQHGLSLMTAITGGANIGPVSATVRKIGLQAEVQFGKPGLLGKADLALSFRPPTGVGLAVAADPVSGGGSLTIEPPIYFGALQLSINDTIGITAFALIATKLPDGSDGFSMVIEIIAEFSPVQLSMGFALTGVGGLLAINRQMSQDGLVAAFKSHSLNFLFPRTGVKDAALIQQSLEGIFPIQVNRYVIGPMVQIIWGGTVKLVTFQIGIFIEFGGSVRIAIIGQARAALPDPEAPILVLNLDVLGFIDCGNETLAIDGGLFDSSLLSRFKLTGGMALRAGWGDDNSSFALAVGGFHPRYTPPPNFPAVARLAITLGEGNPHLSLSTYFAVTTNTIQLGALLDLYASKAGFVITAGLGFDAIVIFRPFYFEFATQAWASVSKGNTELLSIALALVLSGPNPFHATGAAKFTLLFIKVKAHFDATFGDPVGDQALVVSPFDRLIVELNDVRNLHSELPAWASDGVGLAESDMPLLDPVGTIVFAQNAVPLNITMDRFGGGTPPSDERLLNLELLLSPDDGTGSLVTSTNLSSPEKTQFAPEQFHNWTAEQKLSAPAFEEYECGLRQEADFRGVDELSFERTTVSFETIIHESAEYVPPSPPSHPERGYLAGGRFSPGGNRLRGWAGQGALRLFAGLRTVRDPSAPGYVSLIESTYCACSQETTGGNFNTLTEAAATSYVSALRQTTGASPGTAVLLESAFVSGENV